MNMKTIKNLIALGALAAFLGISNNAMALQMFPIEDYQNVVVVKHVTTKTVVDPAPTTTSTNTSTASNTSTTKKVATTSSANTSGSEITTPAKVRDLPPVVNSAQAGNDLTALSLAGSGSFMPSSLWQWILVVLFILVIVIISRILSRPQNTHEVHTVTAH
jgi:hypothetical protein